MLTNQRIACEIAARCGGRGGFLNAIREALRPIGVELTGVSSGGTIFPKSGDYGVSYNVTTPNGPRVVSMRITVEDK